MTDPAFTTTPTDDVGAETLDRFRYQAHLVARACVAMILDQRVAAVICEWHEDYIVQFAGPDGGQKRLVIRQNASRLNLPPASQPVPILVNKKRTKAAFDLGGTSIDAIGNDKRQTAAEKASADARFKRKLG